MSYPLVKARWHPMNKQTKKKNLSFSNFGFSTILLAFVMICIVTFSALSLMTANSDYKLSLKVAEKNSSYYVAEKQAYEILAEIDLLLLNAYKNSSNIQEYYHEVETLLSSHEMGTYDSATNIYSYTIPIATQQELSVVLQVQYPNNTENTFYKIISWKSVYEYDTPDEGTLNLID